MAANPRSHQVTELYRLRLRAVRQRLERQAAEGWPSIDTLDDTGWPERTGRAGAGAQTEAVRVTAGYVTAYVSSEVGRRVPAVMIDSRRYAGVARDGRPLAQALQSPLIGVRAALKDGKPAGEALGYGWNRAARMVETDLMHAARSSLLDAIAADDRIEGWQRATRGTCGACMALSGTSGPRFEVHPDCQCQPQPVVAGVPDRFPLPTAAQLFAAMTRTEQDAQFGEEKAAALRSGDITLTDLVATSALATADDFLTEKPLEAASQST